MRRFAVALAVFALAMTYTAAATADPSHNVNEPLTFTCDNSESVVINPGTVTNQSRQAFVIDSTSIFVIKSLALSDGTGTLVLFDQAPGRQEQGLDTCTTDLGGEIVLTAKGFFTPAP